MISPFIQTIVFDSHNVDHTESINSPSSDTLLSWYSWALKFKEGSLLLWIQSVWELEWLNRYLMSLIQALVLDKE